MFYSPTIFLGIYALLLLFLLGWNSGSSTLYFLFFLVNKSIIVYLFDNIAFLSKFDYGGAWTSHTPRLFHWVHATYHQHGFR